MLPFTPFHIYGTTWLAEKNTISLQAEHEISIERIEEIEEIEE